MPPPLRGGRSPRFSRIGEASHNISVITWSSMLCGRPSVVREEYRVHLLDNVAGHFQERSLVLQRNQSAAGAVLHHDLQRLGKRGHWLDVALTSRLQKGGALLGGGSLRQGFASLLC